MYLLATHAYRLYTISVRAIYQSLCLVGYFSLGLIPEEWVANRRVEVITSEVLWSPYYLNYNHCIRSPNLVIQFLISYFVNFTQLKEWYKDDDDRSIGTCRVIHDAHEELGFLSLKLGTSLCTFTSSQRFVGRRVRQNVYVIRYRSIAIWEMEVS